MESMPILNNWEIFSRKICTQFQAFSNRSPSSTYKKEGSGKKNKENSISMKKRSMTKNLLHFYTYISIIMSWWKKKLRKQSHLQSQQKE